MFDTQYHKDLSFGVFCESEAIKLIPDNTRNVPKHHVNDNGSPNTKQPAIAWNQENHLVITSNLKITPQNLYIMLFYSARTFRGLENIVTLWGVFLIGIRLHPAAAIAELIYTESCKKHWCLVLNGYMGLQPRRYLKARR